MNDSNIILGVLLIILVFTYFTPTISTSEKPEIVYLNDSINETAIPEGALILEPTIIEKAFNWFAGLGKSVSPTHPALGWVVVIVVGWVLLSILGILDDIKDTLVRKKVKSWFRKKY